MEEAIKTDNEKPEKKSNKKKWILAGCGCSLLLLLCFIGALAGAYYGIYSIYGFLAEPSEVVKAHFEAVKDGEIENAYLKYTSYGFQENNSLEDFEEYIEAHPEIYQHYKKRFTSVNIKNNFAELYCYLNYKDGTNTTILFRMIKEEDDWKIDSFEIVSAVPGEKEDIEEV